MIPLELQAWVGRKYEFEDGQSLSVREIKLRDEGQYWVTYMAVTGPGIPIKYVMEFNQFKLTYGHLFP
jgi:hypothetical protein